MRKHLVSFSILAIAASLALAQKRSGKEELEDYFKKWMNHDVVYIITPEEAAVFKKLSTPEEKENFIEQFWARRDPDPRTKENEFKEEHFRRIAYANERFASGIEGWATDRGRTYILFGPPKSVDRNPTGEVYLRNAAEGGGQTFNYPYEAWYYEYIDGVGSGVTLEFIDPSFTGEYRLARHPYEKDALLDKPGQGLTLAEAEGQGDKRARLDALFMGRASYAEGHVLADMARQPFEDLQRYFNLRRPPEFKYKDLQQVVKTRVIFPNSAPLPVEFTYQYFYLDSDHSLAPTCFGLRLADLTPVLDPQGNRFVKIAVYGRVTDLTNKLHYEFEDFMHQNVSSEDGPATVYLYEKRMPLKPGRYKLTAILKDEQSGRTEIVERSIHIPQISPELLAVGSINLIAGLRRADSNLSLTEPFAFAGGFKAYPLLGKKVDRKNKNLGVQFEIYNIAFSRDDALPQVGVNLSIYDGKGQLVLREKFPKDSLKLVGTRVVVLHPLDLLKLAPGEYRLQLSAYDAIRNQEITETVTLSLF